MSEMQSGDQARLRELFNPRKDPLQIDYSLAWTKVKPGRKTLPHSLVYSEVYYILKGTGIMHIDDEQANVSADTAIYIPPHAIQWIENTGDQELTFLCIVNPPWHAEAEQILSKATRDHRS
jgi:mannose-6-phosphate isomerase-like protein (cupin superfamily)